MDDKLIRFLKEISEKECSILSRVELLLETLVKTQLNPILQQELADEKIKELYDLTGKENVRTIESKIGINKSKISEIWQKWEKLGLLKKEGKVYIKVIN